MRRRTSLIKSPLDWHMAAAPVAHPAIPVLAERGGTQLRTPRPTVLVDTREQNPFNFSRFDGWFAGVEKKALKLGDYSIAGWEELCVVERKDLSDLVACRSEFVIADAAGGVGGFSTGWWGGGGVSGGGVAE